MTENKQYKRILQSILWSAYTKKASDIHLVAEREPTFRIHGRMIPQTEEHNPLTPDLVSNLLTSAMSEDVKIKYDNDKEVDFAYTFKYQDGDEVKSIRFRVNVFTQKGSASGVFRIIPSDIPKLEDLSLPTIIEKITELPRGLVLVTGPTGSGKSTTLAAMIDRINSKREDNIITIEDPIEFLHKHKKSVVVQREIGQDSLSFSRALKSSLRQDPDVILLGEMRDLETISLAVTLAETGHLVFATLHTTSAAQTVDRILDVFPPEQQGQIRSQLANNLEAIVAQTLLPTINRKGRVAVTEIMTKTPAISSSIRQGKTTAIRDSMQTGSHQGMHTMEQDLVKKIKEGVISVETAMLTTSHQDALKGMLEEK